MTRARILPVLAAALILSIPVAAHAQGFTAGTIDAIVAKFHDSMTGWAGALQGFAQGTFAILASIGLAWALIRDALNQRDFNVILATLLNQLFFIGFFLFVLQTSQTWGPAIISSFRIAAGAATGQQQMSPGQIFNAGWQIAFKVIDQMSVWDPAQSVGLLIAAVIIIGIIAWLCAEIVVTLVQSWFITGAGVLLLAFGGASFTSEIAIVVLRQTFAIGAKLFTQICIVGLGMNFITEAVAGFNNFTSQMMLALIGIALVLMVLTIRLPSSVERMLGGVGFAGASELVGAAGTAVAGAITAGRGAQAGGALAAGGARWGSGGSFRGGSGALTSRFSTRGLRG